MNHLVEKPQILHQLLVIRASDSVSVDQIAVEVQQVDVMPFHRRSREPLVSFAQRNGHIHSHVPDQARVFSADEKAADDVGMLGHVRSDLLTR